LLIFMFIGWIDVCDKKQNISQLSKPPKLYPQKLDTQSFSANNKTITKLNTITSTLILQVPITQHTSFASY
jgi:hypothetical protein